MKSKSPGTSGAARWFEALLWLGGAVGITLCFVAFSRGVMARHSAALIVAPVSANRTGTVSAQLDSPDPYEKMSSAGLASRTRPNPTARPAVVGQVEIPAIGLTTPLLAGDDSMSLSEGAGHIPGTALPGGLGTVGIAGHRDTHFRSLSHAEPGMEVLLRDRTGTYHYRVTSTEIVTPDQVSVLDIVSTPGLVLITCYPFRYIGTAPKRFVVHAALLSAAPDEVR